MPPVRVRVAPRLHAEMPEPFAGGCDIGAVAVSTWGELAHGDRLAHRPGRIPKYHLRAEHLVSLAEHGRAHQEGFADDRLGRASGAVDSGLDVKYRNPADHLGKLPWRTWSHARWGAVCCQKRLRFSHWRDQPPATRSVSVTKPCIPKRGLVVLVAQSRIRVAQRESNPPLHHPPRAARAAGAASHPDAQFALVLARADESAVR